MMISFLHVSLSDIFHYFVLSVFLYEHMTSSMSNLVRIASLSKLKENLIFFKKERKRKKN